MQILLVEDTIEIAEIFVSYCEREHISLTAVSSLASAISTLSNAEAIFDLIVCDLKIPPEDGSVDLDNRHGLAAVGVARKQCPGVPVIVLSAYGTVDNIRQMLLAASQQDLFGSGDRVPMLQYVEKPNILDALNIVKEFQNQLGELGLIEAVGTESLSEYQRRALKIFARKHHGKTVQYRPLSGGLSGARTGIALVKDVAGVPAGRAVAKITTYDRAMEEERRYNRSIAPRLGAGTFTGLTDRVIAGCARTAGLFYSVAETYDQDLFVLVQKDPKLAAEATRRLAENLAPWTAGVPQTTKTWLEVRRELISDSGYKRVSENYSIIHSSVGCQFQTVWSTQHGDLHGANVLVDSTGHPVLIDFGRSGLVTSCLDPLTLELSILFHPDSPLRDHPWPTIDQIEQWEDLGTYLRGCPYSEYVSECREWTSRARAAGRDMWATMSAYCLRNLQYRDVDSARALAFQRISATRLNESY